MTNNIKRKTLAIAGVLGLAGLVAGAGTLAYFTDTDTATNTFTVGNVDIELLESYLHRVNAGYTTATRLSWDTSVDGYAMLGAAGSAPEDAGGWTGAYYTDAQIEAASGTAYDTYLQENGQNLVPGATVKKMPYVKNNGSVDAYVRVRVLIPSVLDNGILANSMYTGSILGTTDLEQEATLTVNNDKPHKNNIYNEYVFTYKDALKPNQMTFWNAWGDIKLSETATSADIEALVTSQDLTAEKSFGVLVEADAIQATGFDTATAAFAAFDTQN